MLNWRKFFVQAGLLALLAICLQMLLVSVAKADGPPTPPPSPSVPTVSEPVPADPTVADPCFRQDEECYTPVVECDENVFVPLNPDGTWDCPPPEDIQQQLPSEVIGRPVDCPDGTVGRVIDEQLNTTCEEATSAGPEEPSNEDSMGLFSNYGTPQTASAEDEYFGPLDPVQLGGAAVLLTAITMGTLYMIYRKDPNYDPQGLV